MADQTLNGLKAFAVGQDIGRKSAAYGALHKVYGDVAGDPEAAQQLQATAQGAEAFPLIQQGRQQAIDLSAAKMREDQATTDEKQRQTRSGAVVSSALFIKNALERDPNADVGALYDRVSPILGLDPQTNAQTRAALVADPKSAGDIVTAFRLKQAATQGGDPAAVKTFQYYQSLPDDATRTEFLRTLRANATPEIAGQTAAAQTDARNASNLNYAQPIATGKATGAALGKAQGEVAAQDIPASQAGLTQAQLAYESTKQSFNVANDAIDKATAETDLFSAGPLSHLPDFLNPKAAELRGDLTALSSKVVLDTISEMKALSKTGATGLGQLSDREGQLIQSKLGAVLQASRPAILKQRLADLQAQLALSRKRVDDAYAAAQKRGQAPGGDKTSAPAAGGQGSRTEGDNVILKWNPTKGDFE